MKNPRIINLRGYQFHFLNGFALIATLLLMILLTVIAVGLLSLSSITLRSSTHGTAMQTARANARMAMMLALGELQNTLGPDQRATARSEMLAEKPAYPKITGVYKSVLPGLPTDPAAYFKKLRTDSKDQVTWLVSSAKPVTDPVTQTPEALSDDGNAATVDIAEMQTAYDPTGKLFLIKAGKIATKSDSGTTTGSYAWWVDDESQKAKINVTTPEKLATGTNFDEHWALAPAQQSNFFKVDNNPASSTYSPVTITGYDAKDTTATQKLISMSQADIPYRIGAEKDWFRKNQTDFTTWSQGLPIDVSQGRLKQDLSAYLETGAGPADTDPVIRKSGDPGFTGPIFSELDYSANDMPRFGLIKSWNKTGATVTDFDTGGTESKVHTNTENGIHPVILRAGIYYAPYFDPMVGTEDVDVGVVGNKKPAHFITWKLAAFPRVTIWNPTSVPITDPWLLYQVGVTNHVMLYQKNGSDSSGAASDDNNNLYWRTFVKAVNGSDNNKFAFNNMMNANQWSYSVPSGSGTGKSTMPLHTYALRLDTPLLPGQTRTFYPGTSGELLKTYGKTGSPRFVDINNSNVAAGNVMTSTPAPNNYFRVAQIAGTEFTSKIYAKSSTGDIPMTTPPAVPQFLETYLYIRQAESGPAFEGTWTHGCDYRLLKPGSSDPPALLQEVFSAEHADTSGGASGATKGLPTYSISNASQYDDPDDGVSAKGYTLVKFYSDPNRELTSRRGHQIYISYALEDPKNDFNSIYKDSSKQLSVFANYNPRSRYVFPGTYEENKTGVGGPTFDSNVQGVRQELYSEGRPEAAWLTDWSLDKESGYGTDKDFGSPGLYDLNLSSNGLVYPLFDFPRARDGVLSLGELQGVNFATYPWQPGNAFGNSRADPRVPSNQLAVEIPQTEDHPYIKSLSLGNNRYVDLSWLLNFSIWDRFFVSTIPYGDSSFQSKAGNVLRNGRHKLTGREGQDSGTALVDSATNGYTKAAGNIVVDGAFNVNTTSVAAWKQFLSGNFNLKVPVKNTIGSSESSPSDQTVFPRLLYPYRGEAAKGSMDVGSSDSATKGAFSANRSLNDEELQKLAEKIVEEVRLRGPFLSLADFVNRKLVDAADTSMGKWAGLSGTLQTAIDRVTVEDKMINSHLEADSDLMYKKDEVPAYLQQSNTVGRPDNIPQSRLAGAPGSLTQADILRTVGPMLTTRGDTFRIRAYGESRNRQTNKSEAEAWCEVVVQRVATPVDGADDLVAPNETLYRFGRKFQIVSFHWLKKAEL
ncbi:MAG: hypothetical protein QE267_07515 [Akkermansiaceae bacterium]|nr:hypothetical protein [Akkermansiaceae bacterium]